MAKTLSERIASRTVRGRAQHLATFLVLRSDIQQAVQDGWPLKHIWETLHEEGKVAFGYQSFRKYVIKLIAVNDKACSPRNSKVPPPPRSSELPGFKWDPVGKKEDLL